MPVICVDCVTPPPLRKLFDTYGGTDDCKYCGRRGLAMELKYLFDYIYDRVRENTADKEALSHYELCMLYDAGADLISVSEIDVVLAEWFELGEECYFDDLFDSVPPEFIVDDTGNPTHFYGDDGSLELNIFDERWKSFVEDIHYAHRYFNPGAGLFLDSVFSVLVTDGNQLKPEIIRTIAHGELLYRARHAQSQEHAAKLISDPAGQFGPTPRSLASSQRMTPNGISALYCALERETCLSEIRSITGDYVVSVGLTPINEVKLLDLTAMDRVEPELLTMLDEGFGESWHRKVFLGSLVKKMSRPKARNDELSYLSTQVVFEYLRLRFGQHVDGLVFPSVQTGEVGTNVVFFPEASRLSYVPPAMRELGEDPEPAAMAPASSFQPPEKLAVIADTIRFHKVTAIETKARDYRDIHDLFISDLTRRRLGLRE